MQHKNSDVLSWNINDLSKALRISKKDVREYFTDGRRISFLLERRLAKEVLHGKLANSEGEDFDVLDSKDQKWEVRSISKDGVYFCPSYMVGSGRHFEEKGFLTKLKIIKGYIIADIESFPNVTFWMVTSDEVKTWWKAQKLGTWTKVSRKRMFELLSKNKLAK
jgi:hypothetical protein